MNETAMHRRLAVMLSALTVLAVLSPGTGAMAQLPDALVLNAGDVASIEVSLPLSAEVADDAGAVIAGLSRSEDSSVSVTAGEDSGTAEVVFRLLGLVPVKTMKVTVEQPRTLVPGGRSLGVALKTQGVVVVGSSDLGSGKSPARAAGVRPGDVIRTVNGEAVTDASALSGMLDGSPVRLGVLRGGREMELEATPARDPRDGEYRLGVWVRGSTAGVGTLTYYDPLTGDYGALGHAITDADTGVVFPVGEGAVYDNRVVHITRGEQNAPGELTGAFFEEGIELGDIDRNTGFGVFGSAQDGMAEGGLYPEGLPVGRRDEVHTGSAQILSCVAGGEVKAYDCEIERLYSQNAPETRSMVVRITDPELLARTGGIVQGMSGSPVVQDGKLVGAVTHVFVSDPTRGYGVYIEWMLDAAA